MMMNFKQKQCDFDPDGAADDGQSPEESGK